MREERFWQQATYPLDEFPAAKVTGRTRLEPGSAMAMTLSATVAATAAPGVSAYRLSVRVGQLERNIYWPERVIGLNETDWGQPAGFGQNRLFAGISLQALDRVRLEAGYLNQFVDGASRDIKRDNLQLSATISF